MVIEFRSSQTSTGVISNDVEKKKMILFELLNNCDELSKYLPNSKGIIQAFKEDVNNWIKLGLDKKPSFDSTILKYQPPLNGDFSFFIGVIKNQNSVPPRGYFLEFFFVQREEPVCNNILYKLYPHPANICISSKLITGSTGFKDGNCVVFFPENIISNNKIEKQNYALFFFNKFRYIYSEITLPRVSILIQDFKLIKSNKLNERDFYFARCVWGYLHDYFHHQGVKPFNEFLYLKMNWYVGLLEEIKVDCQTAIECLSNTEIPFRREVFEFIIFDRMFRYTCQDDFEYNFDSGTGFLLFNFLLEGNALQFKSDQIVIDEPLIKIALNKLILDICNIESENDEDLIKQMCEQYVGRYLNIEKTPSGRKRIKNINAFQMVQQKIFDLKKYALNSKFSEQDLFY